MTFAMPPRPKTAEEMDREIKELFKNLKRLLRSNAAREASNTTVRKDIIRVIKKNAKIKKITKENNTMSVYAFRCISAFMHT